MIDFLVLNDKIEVFIVFGLRSACTHKKYRLEKCKWEHCSILNVGTKISQNMALCTAEPWSLIQSIKPTLHTLYADNAGLKN